MMTPDTSIYEYARQGLELSQGLPAIWFYGRSMTYAELFRRIDNVADNLFVMGVRRGTVVTIHLPNCPQAIMAIYAVAKLGGICNMVHPQIPLEGLRKNMIFSESRILITGDHFPQCREVNFTDKLIFVNLSTHMGVAYGLAYRLKNGVKRPNVAVPFEKLERPAPVLADVPEQSDLAEKCAVYLHSSGTTGTPKTVMHCHRALNCWVEDSQDYFRDEDLREQVILSALPLHHGTGLCMNLHRVLSGGGQQVLLARWDSREAVRQIKKHGVNMISAVPALFQRLLQCSDFSGPRIRQLRRCFVGGEYISFQSKQAFEKRCGGRLFEGYGMTEIVTASFSTGFAHDNPTASGYPLIHCHLAVLGADGVPQTVGEGELLVSTNSMMLGYFKDPAATCEAFFEWMGRRWFRTGDFGRVDENGYVYFIGRLKNIIVRKGYNIFPEYIEGILRQTPGVRDVCVIGVSDQAEATQLVRACVELEENTPSEAVEKTLLAICKELLPQYSIPGQFRFLTELPRNRMSKIDRKALEKLP